MAKFKSKFMTRDLLNVMLTSEGVTCQVIFVVIIVALHFQFRNTIFKKIYVKFVESNTGVNSVFVSGKF